MANLRMRVTLRARMRERERKERRGRASSGGMSREPLFPTGWPSAAQAAVDLQKVQDERGPSPAMEPSAEIVMVAEGGGDPEEGRWRRLWVVQWSRRRVIDPFVVILNRGLEPRLLSLSTALGVTLGVFPIYGVTVGLCAIAAMLLRARCHVPTLMLANFVVTPLQLGLVIPFLRGGEFVSHGPHFPLSSGALWDVVRGRGSRAALFGILHAVIGWSMFAPACFAVFYILSLPIFQFLVVKFDSSPRMLSSDV